MDTHLEAAIANTISLRAYEARDADALREMMAELQDAIREFDPGLPVGSAMASAYFDYTQRSCVERDGAIFVAEDGGQPVGFVTVLARVPFEGLDSPAGEYAYVMDLHVRPPYRRRGIGTALMREAERYAMAQGARDLRILVLSANPAVRLYRALGFQQYSEALRKPLG
jgi:ribosomal protein S18 acetylase RimI-like enzyme